MSNFDFLKNEYPELAKLGALAEELIDTDAASTVAKLRLITEYIAKDIYYKYFKANPQISQFEVLKELEPYIDTKYMDIFHIIRKIGNSAVHENISSNEKAHQLLKFTYALCVWHYITNCEGDSSLIKPYEKPVSRKLLLEKELEEAKRSAELEAELKIKEEALSKMTASSTEELTNKQEETRKTVDRLGDLTEAQTRNYIIDEMLIEAGWDIKKVEDYNKEIKEYDTKSVKREVAVNNLPNTPSGKGYIDYTLYNDTGKIIAIIEAKKTRRDPKKGKTQAFYYANSVEKETGFRPLIFYTN